MGAAAGAGTEAIDWPAVRAAVALVTRQVTAPGLPRDAVLGDVPPGDVLIALELVTAGVLAGTWPGDRGADVLRRIGLLIAALEAGDPP